MKKLNLSILIILFIALSGSVLSQKHDSYGDSWSLQSIKTPAVLKFGGGDFGPDCDVSVAVTIKNKGKVTTTGNTVKINVKITGKGKTIADKEFSFNPSKTKSGKSYIKNITLNLSDPGWIDCDTANV